MALEEVLAELKARVGQETHVSSWMTIDQERIDQFAKATEDYQWIHTDPQRAKAESPYGRTIAHGFLTLSLIPYLTEAPEGGASEMPGMKMAINYGTNKVRFPNAVPVGSRIRARTTLMEVSDSKGGIQTVDKVTVEIEGQEKPACVAELITVMYF